MSATAAKRRFDLRAIAAETQAVLPDILAQVPSFDTTASSAHHLQDLEPLDPSKCPGFQLPGSDAEAGRKGTRVRVYDQDTFDAALDLQPGTTVSSLNLSPLTTGETGAKDKAEGSNEDEVKAPSNSSTLLAHPESSDSSTPLNLPTDTAQAATPTPTVPSTKPVAVLNLASEQHPGGGWLNGALAQEEALCYRSSLSLSLHQSYYPIPTLSALYSPSVLLIRDAMSRGHNLLYPDTPAQDLPVTSVITVAALRRPAITTSDPKSESESSMTYANPSDRETTKSKIRLTLRLACHQGHTKLVLGALGCGAFGNPPGAVLQCFKEVFAEDEFQGGWWEDVVFAVLDNRSGEKGGKEGEGNFGVFWRGLYGLVV
jgi:uncharacterized protein (TIGR02452 family)